MDIMRLGWDHSGAALTVSVDKKSDASARDGGGEVLRVAGDGINILHFLLGLVVCEVLLFSDYDCVVLWWCQRGIEIRERQWTIGFTGKNLGLGAKAGYF